jgi:hypothetical protein
MTGTELNVNPCADCGHVHGPDGYCNEGSALGECGCFQAEAVVNGLGAPAPCSCDPREALFGQLFTPLKIGDRIYMICGHCGGFVWDAPGR